MDIASRAARVAAVIFDVDGVLTDGTLWLDDAGREYKRFHTRDGHGIKLLDYCGIKTAVISGRGGRSVELRLQNLGIQRYFLGHTRKLGAFHQLCIDWALPPEAFAYVGDDLPDLPVMQAVGLAVAVADADPRVVAQAHYRTAASGGHGAAREVCELVLQARGLWQRALDAHFLPPDAAHG